MARSYEEAKKLLDDFIIEASFGKDDGSIEARAASLKVKADNMNAQDLADLMAMAAFQRHVMTQLEKVFTLVILRRGLFDPGFMAQLDALAAAEEKN